MKCERSLKWFLRHRIIICVYIDCRRIYEQLIMYRIYPYNQFFLFLISTYSGCSHLCKFGRFSFLLNLVNVLLKTALLICMVGANIFKGGTPGLWYTLAWFPATINNGKIMENTQPATTGLLGRLVMTAKGRPNPRKYGQFVSIRSNLLCNSKPCENHLYSKA